MKKELEYSNSQLEKYKKYQTLYLNLLKKVKSNKNLIKNINLNVDKNIKEEYINDLIERGKEINTMLKEDNILENNIKNALESNINDLINTKNSVNLKNKLVIQEDFYN